MTQRNDTGGVSYPTPIAETLAGLAGYPGDDWVFFADHLAGLAGHSDGARDWLYAELTDAHTDPDDGSKPEPPAGFMYALATGLGLDDARKMDLAMAFTFGDVPGGDRPSAAIFRRHPGGGNPDALCVVSHPDAGGQCPRAVVGEVWSMPFCGLHGREAEIAAHHEIGETAGRDLQGYADAAAQLWPVNEYLTRAVESARVPVPDYDAREHERIMREAYPPEACVLEPETAAYDYGHEYAGDGPVDWWHDARELIVRHVREAESLGLATLRDGLEFLRQKATVQQMLAEDDFQRRYGDPKRAEIAARKEAEARLDPHAKTLDKINERLTQAADLLETVPAEGFADYHAAANEIAGAGLIVSREWGRRDNDAEPA